MSFEPKANENEWILTSCTSSTLNIEPKNISNPLGKNPNHFFYKKNIKF